MILLLFLQIQSAAVRHTTPDCFDEEPHTASGNYASLEIYAIHQKLLQKLKVEYNVSAAHSVDNKVGVYAVGDRRMVNGDGHQPGSYPENRKELAAKLADAKAAAPNNK